MKISKFFILSCLGVLTSNMYAMNTQEIMRAIRNLVRKNSSQGWKKTDDGNLRKPTITVTIPDHDPVIYNPYTAGKALITLREIAQQQNSTVNPNSTDPNALPQANRQAQQPGQEQKDDDDPSQQTPTQEDAEQAAKEVNQASAQFKTGYLQRLNLAQYGVTADEISNELDEHPIEIKKKMQEASKLKGIAKIEAMLQFIPSLGQDFEKLLNSENPKALQLALQIVQKYHKDVIVGHWSTLTKLLIFGGTTAALAAGTYFARNTKLVKAVLNFGKNLGTKAAHYAQAGGQWIDSKFKRAPQPKSFF